MQYSVITSDITLYFASPGLVYFITGSLCLLTSLHPFQWVRLFLDLPLPLVCDTLVFPGFSFCYPDHSLLTCVLVAQSCLILCTPRTVACQTPLSMGFSRQEYWSGLPFLLQGIFLTQGSNPGLCTAGRFFTI